MIDTLVDVGDKMTEQESLINEITALSARYYELSVEMQVVKKMLAELDAKLKDNLDLEQENNAKSGN